MSGALSGETLGTVSPRGRGTKLAVRPSRHDDEQLNVVTEPHISIPVTQNMWNRDVAHDAFDYRLQTDLYSLCVQK